MVPFPSPEAGSNVGSGLVGGTEATKSGSQQFESVRSHFHRGLRLL
jgi:hypothetical protein